MALNIDNYMIFFNPCSKIKREKGQKRVFFFMSVTCSANADLLSAVKAVM